MRRVLRFVAWAALVALAVLWWAPSIVLAVVTLAADRARFRALVAWVGLLRILGWRDAARRALEGALQRCEARRQALAARCPR